MERGGLECAGDIRGHLSAGEERLRVTGRDDVELTVVVELADGEQRASCCRCPERKCMFELIPLGIRGPAARQESVRMLSRDAELSGEIRDRQPFAPQECLPDFGFIAHGDDRNPKQQGVTSVRSARECLCGREFLDRGEDLGE